MILLTSLCVSFCTMLLAWFIYLKIKNPALIDIFWGLNICIIGMIHLSQCDTNVLTLTALTLLMAWSVRLSFFLFFTRCFKGKVDPRYEAMANDWKNKAIGFLGQYLLQGLLAWVIALPFFTLKFVHQVNLVTFLSVIFILIGLAGETIADFQLLTHKNSGNKSALQQGLWQYSRHPNYFFECLIWFGFSLMGASSGLGMLSFLSILTLFCIMWFITIPLTEAQSLKRRPSYKAYICSTSCFIPWRSKA